MRVKREPAMRVEKACLVPETFRSGEYAGSVASTGFTLMESG
jgi:hypothetical protein